VEISEVIVCKSTALRPISFVLLQNGHDNWIRALTFHPSGKYLLSASDDKTIRIWDLETGRMSKTIDAHEHFVTCMVWGRTTVGGGTTINGAGKGTTEASTKRRVNVLATGSVDQTIRVSYARCQGGDIVGYSRLIA